jgi:hypothetical protein
VRPRYAAIVVRACIVIAIVGGGVARADDTAPPEPPHSPIGVTVATSGVWGNTSTLGKQLVLGYDLGVGYRLTATETFGLRFAIAGFSGMTGPTTYRYLPIDFAAFAEKRFLGRCWGRAMIGVQLDRYSDGTTGTTWSQGILFGVDGGVEIVQLGEHRFGVVAGVQSEVSDVAYTGTWIGVAYRHY